MATFVQATRYRLRSRRSGNLSRASSAAASASSCLPSRLRAWQVGRRSSKVAAVVIRTLAS